MASKKTVSEDAPAKKSRTEDKTPTLAQMHARVPAIGADERAAFTAQFSNAECATLGAQTRSAAVRECAMTWSASVLKSVTGLEKELVPYAPERLAFVLELIGGLDVVRGKNAKTSATSTALRSERDLSRARLTEVAKRFVPVLTRAVKGNEAASAEVARLRDHGKSDRESAEAVQGLVKVARKLLTGTKAQKIVANSMGLTAARVDAADAAAKALLDARDDVALGASGTHQKDSAEVNVVEGRVLHEMRIMKASIEEARDEGASVPGLVPTAGVAHVFGRKPKKGEEVPPKK
jgi:hypothetical protein